MSAGEPPMRCSRTLLSVPALLLFVAVQALAGPLVVFPKAGQLESPGRHFLLFDRESDAEFGGTFHALWVKVTATGESRKIYDYIGAAAVAWEDDDHLIITEYLSKRTSRALLLSVAHPTDSIIIDVPMLMRSLPSESRETLRENDHVFIEAVRVEAGIFHLRVWGYGRRDPRGFRWGCEYALSEERLACSAEQSPK